MLGCCFRSYRKKGDELQNGYQLASFKDNVNLEVDIPFTAAQIPYITIGSQVDISSSEHMSAAQGVVTHINSVPEAQDDGSALYFATIRLVNPGSFKEGLKVSAQINGMVSPGSGEIRCGDEQTVKTEMEGTLSELYIQNGDYVQKGAVIAKLTSDDLTNSIRKSDLEYDNAQLSLKDSYDKLDDYTIKSPINGTVITKNSKAGDTIDRSNASVTMMVVADVSKLKFNLEIDELDVINVKEGMQVEITCDAVANKTFEGYISTVSVEGTSSDGVTTYAAEVVIDEPGELRPSMNVDASVIIKSAENVLMLPVTDVKSAGNRKYVFTPSDKTNNDSAPEQSFIDKILSKFKDNKSEDIPSDDKKGEEKSDNMKDGAENSDRGSERTDNRPENSNENASPAPPSDKQGEMSGSEKGRKNITAPEGFTVTYVETGISNDDYIEITGGLNEGDMVYRQGTSSSNNNMMMMGGAPGDMGGAPGGGGGMGGGNRGGGMR